MTTWGKQSFSVWTGMASYHALHCLSSIPGDCWNVYCPSSLTWSPIALACPRKDMIDLRYWLILVLGLSLLFFFFLILGSGPFQKSLFNLLKYCFCFMFCFLGLKAFGILAPRPGMEPTLPALELEVLTTGPPQKFPLLLIYRNL